MFKNAYQGRFISIFYSIGSKPLSLWDTHIRNGFIKRITDYDINSLALEIISTTVMNTYITCPNHHFKSLGIKLPFICFLVKNLNKFFTFEVQIIDNTNTKRRLRFSNYHSHCKITSFIISFPLCLIDGWNECKINLQDFVHKSYGTIYLETIQVNVHANCMLRRIFFADKLYPDSEIPAEYKLFRKDQSSLVKPVSAPEFSLPPSDLGEQEDESEYEMGQGDMLMNTSADMLVMPGAQDDEDDVASDGDIEPNETEE